jgi:chromosome segregation ATPase
VQALQSAGSNAAVTPDSGRPLAAAHSGPLATTLLFLRIRGRCIVVRRAREDVMSEERFDRIEQRLDRLEAGQQELRADVNRLDDRVSRMDERVSRMDERVSRMDERIAGMDGRLIEFHRHMLVLHEEVMANMRGGREYEGPTRVEMVEADAGLKEEITRRLDPLEAVVRRHSAEIDQLKQRP